ncbi:MAG: hypothetical protein WCF36_02585 [Candidatus Nanopelagicales bacterium]
MIDPAILRAGRLDVKIRIDRPARTGAREIRYLTANLPIDEAELERWGDADAAIADMPDALLDALFGRDSTTALLRVRYRSGRAETWHLADLVSGAMIANIVDRAKNAAIKTLLATGRWGLSTAHLIDAVGREVREDADLPGATDPKGARVVGRGRGGDRSSRSPRSRWPRARRSADDQRPAHHGHRDRVRPARRPRSGRGPRGARR